LRPDGFRVRADARPGMTSETLFYRLFRPAIIR
jgi:hypothetical protein